MPSWAATFPRSANLAPSQKREVLTPTVSAKRRVLRSLNSMPMRNRREYQDGDRNEKKSGEVGDLPLMFSMVNVSLYRPTSLLPDMM